MPTEKRERLSVQLKPGTKERLEIQAVKDGRSLSNLIKKILEDWLSEREKDSGDKKIKRVQ